MDSPALVCVVLMLGLGLIHGAQAQNTPQDFVDAHNSVRRSLNIGDLTWDDNVASYALNYANQRISDCEMEHSRGPYGENLSKGGKEWSAADAVNSWAAESQYYDYDTNTCADGQVCGHYTQVVWRDSQNLGCASVKCTSGETFIICNYNPAGNYNGERPY